MAQSANARHRNRGVAPPFEVAHNTWIWGYRVPYLPDIGHDRDQVDSPVSMLGYHAMAEAMAATGTQGTAIQIRLLAHGTTSGGTGTVAPFLIGRGPSRDAAGRLAALVRATLPAEVPLEPLDTLGEVEKVLNHVDVTAGPMEAVAEIRRRIEELDPSPQSALDGIRTTPGVQRWAPDPTGLRTACTVLARHTTPAAVVLHMERTRPSRQLLDRLDSTIREVADSRDAAENPLRRAVAVDSLRRLRTLPRAALEVRVLVGAEGAINPGLLESIGISLTAEEAFSTPRPRNDLELLLAGEAFSTATARWWGASDDEVIDELSRITDSGEAAAVVRFPTPMRGGSPGLPSVPLSTLPRAALSPEDTPDSGILIGPGLGGGTVRLSLEEINRHLLVAGLPGFGKTVSVQRLLARLWTEHKIPFLVLDPAKSDYGRLTAELGSDATHIRLGPGEPAFNPFAVPRGCSAHAHAGRVLAAFDSAFGLSATWPLGYVTLARGLFAAYETPDLDNAPTLRSVFAQVGDTLRRSELAGPDGANARASLLTRLEFLVRGPLGAALVGGAGDGADWPTLLARPTVVEMRGFGGPSERALIFALLLAGLISYREANPSHEGLGHVTVLEEAHRVLRESTEESEGVRLFVESIAELRGSGEGFVIVDQAPTMLHPGVLKLSGSVLTHRLIDPNERAVIGSAVLLDSRQQQDLARLETGQAVLFSSKRSNSVVVDVDDSSGADASTLPEERSSLVARARPDLPFCIGCRHMCLHVERATRLVQARPSAAAEVDELVTHFASHTQDLGLARCASAMTWATSFPDATRLGTFLSGLRTLDDAVSAEHRRRLADRKGEEGV